MAKRAFATAINEEEEEEEEMGVERALKRARWRCRLDALCDVCRRVAAIASETHDPINASTLLLLQEFVTCSRAPAAYVHANAPAPPPPLLAIKEEEEETSDGTVAVAAAQEPGTPPLDQPLPVTTWDCLKTHWTADDIARLQQCFTPHTNQRHRMPHEACIRVEFTRTKHDYYIDDELANAESGWYSPSGLLKKLFKPFDSVGVAKRLSQMKTGQWAGRKWEDIVAEWDANRNSGSAKHNAYDKWLQHEPLETHDESENPIEAPPVGFYRAMAWLINKGYDVWRTELSLFWRPYKLLGQADLVLIHRDSGVLVLADFKNCKDLDLYDVSSARGKCGIHPFTASMPDTKGAHYDIQLELYRRMLVEAVKPLGLEVAATKILLNFRPADPEEYYPIERPALDVDPLLALLPWQDDDPRHVIPQTPITTVQLEQALVPCVPDDDPDVQDGTTVRYIGGPPKGPLTDDIVWTGKRYVKNDYCFTEDSKWTHPMRWFTSAPPPNACADYEAYLLKNRELLQSLGELENKQLACWCRKKEERCHADVLVKYARAYVAKPEWRAAVDALK
jgi:hypothetical protein